LFIGSEAMNDGNWSGCRRQTSASESLASRQIEPSAFFEQLDGSGDGRFVFRSEPRDARPGFARRGRILALLLVELGERQDLLQAVEPADQRAARVQVPERPDAREHGHRRLAGNEAGEAIEIGFRHEMIEDVEHMRPGGSHENADDDRREESK
jgi:hypothetical protein